MDTTADCILHTVSSKKVQCLLCFIVSKVSYLENVWCSMLTDRSNSSVKDLTWVCCLEIEWMLKCYLPMFLCSKWSLKQSFHNHFNPGGIYYGAKCYAQTSGQLFITFKWWHFSKYHSSCIINNALSQSGKFMEHPSWKFIWARAPEGSPFSISILTIIQS